MDVPMRDGERRGRGRNGSSNARASRRSDPYARDSRARPNAPSQPARESVAATAAAAPSTAAIKSYPPPEFTIRGASGPTWIVVSNLVVGTSTEDVRLTFSSFGRVEEVKQRAAPSANHPTVSFEVAFDRREDAELAVEKFHGALADGRILQVSIKKPDIPRDAHAQFQRATAEAAAQRPREKASHHLIPAPAPLPYTPAPAAAVAAAIPTAPASMRSRVRTAELIEARAKKHHPATPKSKPEPKPSAPTPTAPKSAKPAPAKPRPLAERIPEPLANRLLTPAQAQKLRAEEAKKKARDDARAKAIAATGKNTVLGKRLGGLPLAQRLVQQAGTPKSDQSSLKAAADKKKRKKDAARAKKAKTNPAAMDLDG